MNKGRVQYVNMFWSLWVFLMKFLMNLAWNTQEVILNTFLSIEKSHFKMKEEELFSVNHWRLFYQFENVDNTFVTLTQVRECTSV